MSVFQKPDSRYRSLPFWGWNAKLDEQEICRQIDEMHRAGIGGFFMHSRDGLETPYMGDEWMRLVRAAAQKAHSLGMQAWLYDEDRWPSGTAGGSITHTYGDESRLKGLTLEVCEGLTMPPREDTLLAAYAAVIGGMDMSSLRRLGGGEAVAVGETLLLVRLEISGKSEWFNNEAPPDNLNPRSVRRFIEATHERYKAEVGDLFGTAVPGIFTDEPSVHDRHASFPPNRGWIPWTTGFSEYFHEKRGYDPLTVIPWLYFNGEGSAKIRHDYWRTVAERFCESYSGQIGEWCKQNGIAYTGHFLQEHKLGLSCRVSGSTMPNYRHQDIPGIDILTESTEEYITVKQCSSVASQYGKPVVLSETFAGTGWEFSFEGQKWVGDWQFALGVNRLSKHMAFYSLKGCSKRDSPPSFNYNTSWWEHAAVVENYFSRLSAALTQGETVRDILVLHPASTAWSRFGCSPYGNPVRREERDLAAVDMYGDAFNNLLRNLSGIHYDYDLGDELLMEADAVCENGTVSVAKASYQMVVIPPVDTLLSSTVRLLQSFLSQGGFVIAMDPLPTMVDAEPADLSGLLEHPNLRRVESFRELIPELEALLARRISIRTANGYEDTDILYILKDVGEEWLLFICNNDRNRSHEIILDVSGIQADGSIRELDALTGDIRDRVLIYGQLGETLGPVASRLYLIPKKPEVPADMQQNRPAPTLYTSFSPECGVRRNMPNSLTLDRCRWRFSDSPWSEEMETWQAQKQIRETLGMESVHLNGLVQRYKWVETPHPQDGRGIELAFSFEADIPIAGVRLVTENRSGCRIVLNGAEVENISDGWFLDKSFECVALPALQSGTNTLSFNWAYLNCMELEDIYLIGDFAVDGLRRIVPEHGVIRTGDWTLQGYPHYIGSLTYRYEWNIPPEIRSHRIFLKLGSRVATTVGVIVNGSRVDVPWRDTANVDITGMIAADGNALIEVEVVSSPRNLLGPFHLTECKTENTHDESFRPTGCDSIDGYQLYPYGLYEPPKILIETL